MASAKEWVEWLDENPDDPDFDRLQTAFVLKTGRDSQFANAVNEVLFDKYSKLPEPS